MAKVIFYGRLADMLKNKLEVIVETGRAMTDIIEADRAARLEWTIVLLILAEILITIFQIVWLRGGH